MMKGSWRHWLPLKNDVPPYLGWPSHVGMPLAAVMCTIDHVAPMPKIAPRVNLGVTGDLACSRVAEQDGPTWVAGRADHRGRLGRGRAPGKSAPWRVYSTKPG